MAVFVQEYDPQSLCNVHAAFEGVCYCNLRLPCLVSVTYHRGTHRLTIHLAICVGMDREIWCSNNWCTSNFSTWPQHWNSLWHFIHYPNSTFC